MIDVTGIVVLPWCYPPRFAAMANTTSLKLPDALKEKVADLAHGVAQTPHAYMVEAIAEKVARDEKRRAFLEAGHASLAHFKRTGVAYTHADVKRYLLGV